MFYAVLPMVLSYVTTSTRSFVFLAVSMVVLIGNQLWMPLVWTPLYPENQQYLVKEFIFFNFFSQLPVFAIGIAAYFAIRDRSFRGTLASLAMAVCASVASVWLRGAEVSVPNVLKHHVAFSAGIAAIVVLLARHPFALVVNPATRFLGKLSYGLYLIHFAVIHFLASAFVARAGERGDVQSISFCLITLGVATLLAFAANKLVEEPGISMGKRMIAWSESRALQRL